MQTALKTPVTTFTVPSAKVASTRDRILQAARRVFAEKGYEGTRIDDIVAQAKVNRALVSYYFKSKKNLYHLLFGELFHTWEELGAGFLKSKKSPPEKLSEFVDRITDFCIEKDDLHKIFLRELLNGQRNIQSQLLRNVLKKGFQFCTQAIREGKKTADFSSRQDPSHLFFSILGCVTLYFILAELRQDFFGKRDFSSRGLAERREQVLDLIFHGVLNPQARSQLTPS
jgi:TetR/AcrR family transcriptional regulator